MSTFSLLSDMLWVSGPILTSPWKRQSTAKPDLGQASKSKSSKGLKSVFLWEHCTKIQLL